MPGKTHRVGPSIIQTAKDFASEELCHEYLAAARWPEGVRCLQCDSSRISKFAVKGQTRTRLSRKTGEPVTTTAPDRYMYQCLDCKYQFAATTGTLFSDTHLELRTWMQAIALMCTAKKGISAKQMERTLGISYKTAWYLNHRIRKAMEEGISPLFTGTVEADETYVGGKFDKRRKRAKYDKEVVFGMLERETGRVHAAHVPGATRGSVTREINAAVGPEARFMTDESMLYKNLKDRGFEHEIVVHSVNQWVRGECHTQGIDGFWSLLKRGLIGSFHQVSIKHLNRYISEFGFRYNHRFDIEIFAAVVIALVAKGALRYEEIISSSGPLAPTIADAPKPDDDVPF